MLKMTKIGFWQHSLWDFGLTISQIAILKAIRYLKSRENWGSPSPIYLKISPF